MNELPSDWSIQPLGEGCKVQGGFAFKSGDYTKNGKGIPIIKIGDLQNGRVHVGDKSTRVPGEFLENNSLEKFLLRNGDILIAMTGATTGKIGKFDSNASGNAFLNQRVGRFLIDDESLLQEFIQFLAQTDMFQQRIQENILAAAQGNISPKKLESIPIPLPPLPEQRKIAHILSTVQRAIEEQERIIQTTTELKKALMHKLFTEGLRNEPQKQTEIGLVPVSWDVVRIGDWCSVSTGTTPSTKIAEYYVGSNPFIKTGEIRNNRILSAAVHISDGAIAKYNLKIYKPGTLLIAMYGQGKTRGQISLLNIPASTSQNSGAISPKSEVDSEYLWYYLMSQYEQLRRFGIEGHISHLNLGYVKEILFPKPSLHDQRQIASTFHELDRKTTLHSKKREMLQDLFRTLLHELMSAKIRVHKVNIEAI